MRFVDPGRQKLGFDVQRQERLLDILRKENSEDLPFNDCLTLRRVHRGRTRPKPTQDTNIDGNITQSTLLETND